MFILHHQGEGGGITSYLQHPQGQGYSLHLARQLHTLHKTGLYGDTLLHCDDGLLAMNRLLAGLFYPQVAASYIFCLPDQVDLILPDMQTEEVEEELAKLLFNEIVVKGENDEKELINTVGDNLNDDFAGGFGSGLINTEITEFSPDINVKVEVKKEYEDHDHKWTCYICQETFRYAEQLTRHALEQHNTDRPFHCSYCQFTCRRKGQLQHHERIHTRANEVSCDVCSKSFLDMRDLKNHISVHSDVKNMACEQCDKSFKSDLNLKRHVKLMHNNNPVGEFKCEICNRVFKSKDYLNRHKRKTHGSPEERIDYPCSFCGKNFKSASNRKDHEEIHRGEADADCEVCGAQVRKSNMKNHMKTHSDDADFQCDICAKPSKTYKALRAHLNSHELPFKCEYCEKAFSSQYTMKYHTVQQHLKKKESNSKSKTNKPMVKCDQCDYQCVTSRYMKTHKAVKHDGLFHKCQYCQFTTGDLSVLGAHRRAKHEGVVYSCDQCEFKSGYKNNLTKHKAVAHFTVDGHTVFSIPH